MAFLLLTLPALGGISAVTIWRQYENSRQQTIVQLTSVATLKQTEVITWFNSLAPDLELVVADPRVRSDITQLISTQHNEFVTNAWRGVLLDTFKVALIAGHKFDEIFLMDTTGTVIVSTNPIREGQSFGTQPFFKQGMIARYVQTPSDYSSYGTVIFATVPVRDEKQVVKGVLAGVTDLDVPNNIMQERAGLGNTGETYLVSLDYRMLTAPRDPGLRELPTVHTQGVLQALQGRIGSALYENYQSPPVPVVGVYRWIPELQVALLAEQSQTEAFEDTVWGIWTLLGITVVVAVLTVAAAFAVSRSIATPIEDLTALATRIAGGDLSQTVRVERTDEIGSLANTFNMMTTQLRELIADLEERVAARTTELQRELAERARAEDALQKARNNLSALYQVTATSSQALNLSAILDQSLAQTVEALHSNGGIALLLDKNQDESSFPVLRLVVHHGISRQAAAQVESFIAHQGIASWVMEHRAPRLIPEATAGDRLREPVRQLGHMAIVLAPMRAEEQVWGMLGLIRMNGAGYREEEIALLTSIADQVGVAVRSDYLRQRAHQATILEERQRLARELHDSVTQMLYSVMLFAEAARDSIEKTDLSQVDLYLKRVRETAQQALREMRLLIYESRQSTLEQEGLIGALRRRLEVVENRSGIEVQLLADGPIDLPAAAQIELYGIVQEALNNVLKHSAATRVTIQIVVTDQVQLQVSDNGKGFVGETIAQKAGIGLASMRERAERLGGTLQILSTPGKGTSIQFRAPLTSYSPHLAPVREEMP